MDVQIPVVSLPKCRRRRFREVFRRLAQQEESRLGDGRPTQDRVRKVTAIPAKFSVAIERFNGGWNASELAPKAAASSLGTGSEQRGCGARELIS